MLAACPERLQQPPFRAEDENVSEDVLPPAALELPQQRGERNLLRLRDRAAGHAVMAKLLSVQRTTPLRSRLSRAVGRSPLTDEARPWFLGALGEVAVGRLLEKMSPQWHVLHAVPVGKDDSDIDHVVIGPGGVFTINTKHHRGQSVWIAGRTFMVAGHRQPYLRNAEHEARRASRLLAAATGAPVTVTAVVAVVGAKSLTVKEQPSDVVVLDAAQLVRWLNKRPAVLTAAQAARLLQVADQPETWQVRPPVEAIDPNKLRTAFDDLHREVRAARLVRLVWATAVGGTGLALSATVGPELVESLLRGLLP